MSITENENSRVNNKSPRSGGDFLLRKYNTRLKISRAGELERAQMNRRGRDASDCIPPRWYQPTLFRDTLNRRERPHHRIGKPKVLDAVLDLTVLDQERAVPRHPGQNRLGRVDQAVDVMEPRHQNTPLHRRDHLLGGFVAGADENIQAVSALAVLIGGQGMTGRFDTMFFA